MKWATIQLQDENVVLRPFQFEDLVSLYQAARESLDDLKPWMSWAHDGYSKEEAESFIKITRARWEDKSLYAFAIVDANNGDILGGCSLSNKHPVYYYCNVGYWVRTSRQGSSIAGRAAKLAARYGFEHAGIIRAEIVMALDNVKSRRVAEKINAHYEGILLNRMVVGKAIYDAHMYSLLPSDFGLVAEL
ncbi:MAG TPA: GNAT family protein [Anaerolineales bacterium]|nr:GNAT family protein [Anaerolineales bacterium]